MQDYVEKMLIHDAIQPWKSPWASPVARVKKKDYSSRFTADYRKMSNVIMKGIRPLPRIDDTLDCSSQWA